MATRRKLTSTPSQSVRRVLRKCSKTKPATHQTPSHLSTTPAPLQPTQSSSSSSQTKTPNLAGIPLPSVEPHTSPSPSTPGAALNHHLPTPPGTPFERSPAPSPSPSTEPTTAKIKPAHELRVKYHLYGRPITSFEEFTDLIGLVVAAEVFDPEDIWWHGHGDKTYHDEEQERAQKDSSEAGVKMTARGMRRVTRSQARKRSGVKVSDEQQKQQQQTRPRKGQRNSSFSFPTATVFELRFIPPVGAVEVEAGSRKPSESSGGITSSPSAETSVQL